MLQCHKALLHLFIGQMMLSLDAEVLGSLQLQEHHRFIPNPVPEVGGNEVYPLTELDLLEDSSNGGIYS
jgi:hypothetical protein